MVAMAARHTTELQESEDASAEARSPAAKPDVVLTTAQQVACDRGLATKAAASITQHQQQHHQHQQQEHAVQPQPQLQLRPHPLKPAAAVGGPVTARATPTLGAPVAFDLHIQHGWRQ